MPCDLSSDSATLPSEIGDPKLGQPVPESNMASDLNRGLPQQTHLYTPLSPGFCLFPEKGRSVPFIRVTWY